MRYGTDKRRHQRAGKAIAAGMLLFGAVLLGACGRETVPTDSETVSGIRLYRLNEEATRVVGEAYELKEQGTDAQVEELLAALSWEPEEERLSSVMTENVRVLGYSMGPTGVLTLQFDSSYTQTGGVTEVLMRAAIVKTLCQVDGVTSVEFYVGRQPLMRGNGRPVGMMKAEDFIDNTGAETEFYQEVYLTLYFSDEAGTALVESDLKVTYDGTISTEQLVLGQLGCEPAEEGMRTALPEGTVVNKVTVWDGVCYVDFNEKFMEKRSDVSEEVTVYSVVNSLIELPNIYKVQLTVNGETRKLYQNLDISAPLERNLDIIEGQQ